MSIDSAIRFNLSRRGFLLGSAAALACSRGWAADPACTLTPEQENGPYYIDYQRVRPDITEGRPGLPLKLRLALVDANRCTPIENAALDIWHCDAEGVYSGFAAGPDGGGRGRGGPGGPGLSRDGRGPGGPPGGGPGGGPPPARVTDANRFLRGVQVTDGKGVAEFATLYPGWYVGRAIHIHVKVHLGGSVSEGKFAGGHVSHTGQVFLPEDITQDVAKMEPYVKRQGVHRTLQTEDGVFRGQRGSESLAALARLRNGSDAEGFLATITLAVDPDATPAAVGGGGRGGRRGPGPGGL